MGARENKELIRRLFVEGLPGSPEGLDRFFAPTYKDHAMWKDLPGLKSAVRQLRMAHPNIEWHVEDSVADGDRVAVRCVMRLATTVGRFKNVGSISIFRVQDGKVAESWGYGEPLV